MPHGNQTPECQTAEFAMAAKGTVRPVGRLNAILEDGFLRTAFLLALDVALLASTAAGADSARPLTPGQPAGIRAAQSETSQAVLIGLGAGLTGIGIALIASNGKAGGAASTTVATTSTNP